MYRYAINPSKDLTICDCEVNWNPEIGWTEEMYTGKIYKCKLVNCPYTNAVLSDFDVHVENITFNEKRYLKRITIEKDDELRSMRQNLLTAFDKYKANVLVGIEKDSALSKEVLNWYQAILDLDEEAINKPPERIKYYMN